MLSICFNTLKSCMHFLCSSRKAWNFLSAYDVSVLEMVKHWLRQTSFSYSFRKWVMCIQLLLYRCVWCWEYFHHVNWFGCFVSIWSVLVNLVGYCLILCDVKLIITLASLQDFHNYRVNLKKTYFACCFSKLTVFFFQDKFVIND